MTFSAENAPSFNGSSGVVSALYAMYAPANVRELAPAGRAGKIDGHVAAVNNHFHANVVALAAPVDVALCLVRAVRNFRDGSAALLLRLGVEPTDGFLHHALAVPVEQLDEAPLAESAGRQLRTHVAHRVVRKADVVADERKHFLIDDTGFVDLQLIELQPFAPRVVCAITGAEARREAADIDPVRANHRERHELGFVEDRRVHHDVVQVLARGGLVVVQQHVAGAEARSAIPRDRVLHHYAQVRNKVRHAADVLRDQRAVRVEQRRAVVAHLVDHHVVRRALQIHAHLVGDGRQRVADDFERNGVQRFVHAASSVAP